MTSISGEHNNLRAKISVLLPVYNGGDYLKLSVKSVLAQNLQQFELLIIDDCSTDESYAYLKALNDPRIRLFKNENNKGLFYNLNFLIRQSTTGLLKLWAQDDIMYADCLQEFVEFHHQHPAIGFSYSGRDMIDENGVVKAAQPADMTPVIVSTALHTRIAYYTGSIAGNIANVCISKDALNQVGNFKEHMKISADFDMWVRLAENHETGFIRKPLIQLRDHEKQLSRAEEFYINHVKEDLEVYRYLDAYVTPLQKQEGHSLIRTNKLMFYFTLMTKTFLKGNLKAGMQYFRLLSNYENIGRLVLIFIRIKILKQKPVALDLKSA